ncbi:MAG: Holliday junction branch migration protein RuvA [Proteobacteria bacterium]|nr:Holliday junction branch migration protein RuvA [Pseudomonadota bacterium]
MIAQLRGTIVHTDTQLIIIDVQGVGYAVHVSGRTQGQLSALAGDITLLTEMQVREDSMTLFGFIDAAERDAFRLLITVQGVGAKAAMAILSVLDPNALTEAIVAGDKAMVARADGVGPKIAQRVVNELSEKIGKIPSLGGLAMGANLAGAAPDSADAAIQQDALSALVNLGYGRSEAHSAVIRAQRAGADASVSSLIAAALREMGT